MNVLKQHVRRPSIDDFHLISQIHKQPADTPLPSPEKIKEDVTIETKIEKKKTDIITQ